MIIVYFLFVLRPNPSAQSLFLALWSELLLVGFGDHTECQGLNPDKSYKLLTRGTVSPISIVYIVLINEIRFKRANSWDIIMPFLSN